MEWLILIVALGVGAALLLQRIAMLERRIGGLERQLDRLSMVRHEPVSEPVAAEPAPVLVATAPPLIEPEPVAPPPPPPPNLRARFERIVGSYLPIWIGGAALVLAGFFLVRYSIEMGLLGPGARTLVTALFGLLLLAASEAARRFPATAEDPRVGQALAGAGIATLYAALYVGAAIYHLVGAGTGFALMIAITATGLGLSLRHGAATAVMALIGGFTAPLLAGFDHAGVGPMLVYLALLIAALFALALRRGWAWLALAAAAGGFVWVNILLVTLQGHGAEGIGAFVLALAVGATLAQPEAGARFGWLRLLPMLAGLLQLLAVAPVLQFGALAWGFYLILSAAALWLGWREPRLLLGGEAALALVLVMLVLALEANERGSAPLAALAATALFGGVGFLFSRSSAGWARIALGGMVGPMLVAELFRPSLLPDAAWAVAGFALGAAAAALSWRHRDRTGRRDLGLVGGATVAALVIEAGLAPALEFAWLSLPLVLLLGALYLWGERADDAGLRGLPFFALLGTLALAWWPLGQFAWLIAESLTGTALTFKLLPALADTLRLVALPAAAVLALGFAPRAFGWFRRAALTIGTVLGLLVLYQIAKLPLAIATPERFVTFGLGERAAITQALFVAAFLLQRRAARIALGLMALALFRAVWLDILVFDPLFVAQQVGDWPLANLAVAHAALAAFWLWRWSPARGWRIAAMAATLLALGVAVRQATHGGILTGPIGRTENWLYSAALLGLAIAWLAQGIRTAAEDLRLAGLALLTLATVKVFVIDAAALGGVLRILSFLGLGVALIAIGWAYGRIGRAAARAQPSP